MRYQTSNEMEPHVANATLPDLTISLESLAPSQFNTVLRWLISYSDGGFLLTREQTIFFLNIPDDWLSKLITSGELICTEDGCFRVDAVYAYKQKKHRQTRKALEEMADLENSETTEIY